MFSRALVLGLVLAFLGNAGVQAVAKAHPAKPIKVKQNQQDLNESLYDATLGGSLKTVQALIAQGANPNGRNENGETILMGAAMGGDPQIIQCILSKHTNPNTPGTSGGTPLSALLFGKEGVQLASVQLLVTHGARVNDLNKHYSMPLILAAHYAGPDIVGYLLKKGAFPGGSNGDDTALTASVRGGNLDNAKLLIAAHADVNERLSDGTTALSLAQASQNDDFVNLLQTAGAKP